MDNKNNFSNTPKQFFKGKSYCLDLPTSLGSLKKSKYLQFIKDHGGKVDFSITSKTSYYITSIENVKNPSTRTKTAIKNKTPILLDTFIYECFTNNECIDIYDYLYIDGKPASETIPNFFNIEENVEQSIKETFSILNSIKSSLNCYNSSINNNNNNSSVNNSNINYFDQLEPEIEKVDDDNESIASFGFSLFSDSNYNNKNNQNNNNNNNDDDDDTRSTCSTFSNFSYSSNLSIKNKPLSRFEQILLEKKEQTQKRKEELKRIEDEKKKAKQDVLDQKKKEKEEKLMQIQKEKEEKLLQEKERRKQVLEKTRSSPLSTFNSKPTLSNITSGATTITTSNTTTGTSTIKPTTFSSAVSSSLLSKYSTTATTTSLSFKKPVSSLSSKKNIKSNFSIKIDHEAIKIQKEKEREERAIKAANDLLIKKQEKEERTRIYHQNKMEEEERLEQERIQKQKESLEAFLKRQEKRLKKEQEALERQKKEEALQNSPPAEELPNEDLRKLFVGGINCDDLEERIKKDVKKVEKIRLKRLNFLLHQFDQFGEIQKRTVKLDKGIFFITYKNIESCEAAVQYFSTMENKLKAIESIKTHPNALKLPNTVPNKMFYCRIVKNNEKAKIKHQKDIAAKESTKAQAKQEFIKKEEAELNAGFENWITVSKKKK